MSGRHIQSGRVPTAERAGVLPENRLLLARAGRYAARAVGMVWPDDTAGQDKVAAAFMDARRTGRFADAEAAECACDCIARLTEAGVFGDPEPPAAA